jgi:hypothetical protein
MPNVNKILSERVEFQLESIDRMLLDLYMPRLQTAEGLRRFLGAHRRRPIASPALPRVDRRVRALRPGRKPRRTSSREARHTWPSLLQARTVAAKPIRVPRAYCVRLSLRASADAPSNERSSIPACVARITSG